MMVLASCTKVGINYPEDAKELDTEKVWKDITDYFEGEE